MGQTAISFGGQRDSRSGGASCSPLDPTLFAAQELEVNEGLSFQTAPPAKSGSAKRRAGAELGAASCWANFNSALWILNFLRAVYKGLEKKLPALPPPSSTVLMLPRTSLSSLPFGEKKKKKERREEWERGGEREKVSSRSHIGEEAGLAMPLNILLLGSSSSVSHTHPRRAEANYSHGQH